MPGKDSTSFRNKRVRVYPDWSNLHFDLLGKIFNCLNVVDKLGFKSVCSSWRTLAKAEIKSFLRASVHKSPHLLLPGDQAQTGESSCMFSLEDETFMPVKMPPENHLIGSCRGGWLLLVKKKINLVLWNPLFDVQIHLSSVLTFPRVKSDSEVSEDWITKAVLFGSDPISSTDYGVVVVYGCGKLAFIKHGDSQWSDLGSANQDYSDVTCFKNSVLALTREAGVEVWNFSTSNIPKKTMENRVPFPQDMPESEGPLRDKYTNQFYIVESQGSILLLVRWIGNFVDPDGVLRAEDDLMEEDDPFLICPYLTKKFYVYKLDSDAKRWIHAQSLGNKVLFVGGNQSVSFHAAEDFARCEKNSIYFTDDYWGRMDEHDCYGGHDMGIFSLEDGSIEEIYRCELDKISPPFWVLPNALVEEPCNGGYIAS